MGSVRVIIYGTKLGQNSYENSYWVIFITQQRFYLEQALKFLRQHLLISNNSIKNIIFTLTQVFF